MSLRRITNTRPGYDCIAKPCGDRGCGTNPGASHGRHGDEWIYTVTDGQTALSLVIFTNRLGGEQMPCRSDSHPMAANLDLHTPYPRTEEQIREGEKPNECEFIDCGRCFMNGGSILAARDLYQPHRVDSVEQTEAFWLALEAKWREWTTYAESERPDRKIAQCPCCKGAGTVAAAEAIHA